MRRYVEIRAQKHRKLIGIDDLEHHQAEATSESFELLPKEIVDDRNIVEFGSEAVLAKPLAYLAITVQSTMFGWF